MKSLQYNRLSDDDIINRYFLAQDGGYFLKQEIPKLHKEMQQRGLIWCLYGYMTSYDVLKISKSMKK